MKKGQAALEFLATYGWAFLVILVMIGALAYFGVLDPSRYISESCGFGAELPCEKDASLVRYDAAGDQVFTLTLTNLLASDKQINFVTGDDTALDTVSTSSLVKVDFDDPAFTDATGNPSSAGSTYCFMDDDADPSTANLTVSITPKTSNVIYIHCKTESGGDNNPNNDAAATLGITASDIGKKIKMRLNIPYRVQGFSVDKRITGELFMAVS